MNGIYWLPYKNNVFWCVSFDIKHTLWKKFIMAQLQHGSQCDFWHCHIGLKWEWLWNEMQNQLGITLEIIVWKQVCWIQSIKISRGLICFFVINIVLSASLHGYKIKTICDELGPSIFLFRHLKKRTCKH